MRFRRLELIRYGAYADRALDFGDGRPDLHLIVGPNEAGKSTLLSAIEDLLFGFHGQTAQGWKYDYNELRLRALIEHDGEALDVTRRKGNKNTLLDSAGVAIDDSVLSPFVGGYDRAAFERMFGLDQEKLRAGGQAILDGRDDVARTLFQAGSGLSTVGAQLKTLEAEAGALFKPSASNPTINALLRQRQELLKTVRDATLSEAELTAMRLRQEQAGARRDELISEAEELGRRANVVERVLRTRAPLNRLAAARSELLELGAVPVLPSDAATVLSKSRSERAIAQELLAQHQQDLDEANAHFDTTILPEELLSEQVRIESLDERRPAIEKAQGDLTRRLTELEGIEERIATGRTNAGLAENAALPPDNWLRRAAGHLEKARALATRAVKLESDRADHALDLKELAENLASNPVLADPGELRAAAAEMPADAETRHRKSEAAAKQARSKADTSIIALRWSGTAQTLAQAALPSMPEVAAAVKAIERAVEERRQALKDVEAADRDIAEQQRRISQLSAGQALPTPDAVSAAREERDEALTDVRRRLAAPRGDDDPVAGDRLAGLIIHADNLVDQRDRDAARVAEYVIALAALEEARTRRGIAEASALRWLNELASIEAKWSSVLSDAGLPAELQPVGFEVWRAERERTLEAIAQAAETQTAFEELHRQLELSHERLGKALADAAVAAPGGYAARLRESQAVVARLDQASLIRAGLIAQQKQLDRRTEALGREGQAVARLGDQLATQENTLCQEGGVGFAAGALERAVEELGLIAADVITHAGLVRQVAGIRHDARIFGEDVAKLLGTLGRASDLPATEVVRDLAHELKAAIKARESVLHWQSVAERAATAIKTAERRIAVAQAQLDALMHSAGAALESDLDPIIASASAVEAARAKESDALRELTDVGDGIGIEELEAESRALPADQAAAEKETLAARRREIETEREEIGRSLAQAQSELDRTAVESAAAEAQQGVADTQAALAAAAERYVGTTVSAALLRWLIDRYRASSQAPLLARAGDLFMRVTGGAYTKLLIDYDSDDRARIVALRANGDRVGVEGLSEGARDQLYLALRLAALQERDGANLLPLVCDDLLASSDPGRAGRMLEILSKAAKTAQVLVFSHHDHIIDVARKTISDDAFRLHRLEHVGLETAA